MKRAVFYGRYSSDRQTEQSIEGQRRVCEEFAKAEGILIVGEYIDRATSGTSTDHREQFQRMISDSKNSDWDYVLVYKLDRFARNRYDSAVCKQKLKRNGVKVLSATERITDSPEGILIEGLLESMDEYFSRELSRKCKRGIRETIIKGYNFTKPPFGYKKIDHKFVIDEEAAHVVREIFDLYNYGDNLQAIANKINAKGYRTSRGNLFQRYAIRDILHNDKYTGTHYITDFDEPETCPPIITRGVFDLAQERLHKSAHNARNSKTDHVFALTGIIECGECGSAVVGTSTQRKYFYYTCISRRCKSHPNPHALNVNADKVESAVLVGIQEYFTADRIEDLSNQLYELYVSELNAQQPDHEKRLADVERQIQGAVTALIACPESKALQDRLTELEQQKREIQSIAPPLPELGKEYFRNFFRYISVLAENADDRKQLFNAIVNRVILYKDHVIIVIKFTDNDTDPPSGVEIKKYFSDCEGDGSMYPTLSEIICIPPFLICFVNLPSGRNRREGV